MGNKANYIKWIRSKVGYEKIILVFAGGCIFNEKKVTGGELFCDKDETLELKYFPLNGLPELFCKQHEELADDIQKIYE